MPYSGQDIEKIYAKIKKLAEKALKTGNIAEALRQYDNAAIVASNLNWIFKDDEIEDLLEKLSAKLIHKQASTPKHKNRFVFYDHIGSNYVLAVQYLRALMSWDAEILYVLEPSRHTTGPNFIDELKAYGKASVLVLPERIEDKLKDLEQIYRRIHDYGAAKAFIHAPAEGAFFTMLWHALDEPERYRIVPGDHHFYLGTRISDYVIEFRDFGLALSYYYRGYRKEQLLCQSYYPIVNKDVPFEGFPSQVQAGNIVVVSGGAMYKILGAGERYLHLVKDLLEYNEKLVVLYAGLGNSVRIQNFIRKHHLEQRFILLGQRKDIYQLIRNSDIYLGTYPFSGGLLTQLAVLCEKPLLLLSYFSEIRSSDSLINYGIKDPDPLSFFTTEAFLNYGRKLIDDAEFRQTEGIKNRGRVISPEQFSVSLRELLSGQSKAVKVPVMPEGLLKKAEDLHLEIADKYTKAYELFLFQAYGFKIVCLFPGVFFKAVTSYTFVRRIIHTARKRMIKNRIGNN